MAAATQIEESIGPESDPPEKPKRVPVPRSAPKWEGEAKDRVRAAIRKFSRPLSDLMTRNANEGDTRLLVTDFLCDALGYDKYTELTTEYQVKGEFADYGVKIDGDLIAFIEVKRVGTKLDKRHLRQAEMYAVNEGVEWIILTNGDLWQVYHVTGALPVEIELSLDMSILREGTEKVDQFFYLTKESLKRRQITEQWKAKRATSPKSLAQVIFSPLVVLSVQKELKRQTGHAVSLDDVNELLKTVLRPECFETESPVSGKSRR